MQIIFTKTKSGFLRLNFLLLRVFKFYSRINISGPNSEFTQVDVTLPLAKLQMLPWQVRLASLVMVFLKRFFGFTGIKFIDQFLHMNINLCFLVTKSKKLLETFFISRLFHT